MLDRYASAFAAITSYARDIECRVWHHGLITQERALSVSDPLMRQSSSLFDSALTACTRLNLVATVNFLTRHRTDFDFPILVTDMQRTLKEFRETLEDELQYVQFLVVHPENARLYENETPFGPLVRDKFPAAGDDIQGAAQCYALGQPTACVFHLMRVMELGVGLLKTRFRVKIPDPRNETWANIIRLVNVKIEALPTKTARQRGWKHDLATASAQLNAVRIATRNNVMHPKQTYTSEQASDVYASTRAFMIHLAGLI
jgi:hypothetical protein